MALFSKSKNQEIRAGSSEASQLAQQPGSSVPVTLPDTVVDKLSSGGGTGAVAAEVQTEAASRQKPNDLHKRIPPEIVHERNSLSSRIPVNEIRYVTISPNPASLADKKSEEEIFKEKTLRGMNAEQFNSISFFSKMEKFFTSGNSLDSFSSTDLLGKMKEYHDSIKTGNSFFLHDAHAQEQIFRKVNELKELEIEWVVRKKELESMEAALLEKESHVEAKFEELRKLMANAEKYRLFNLKCSEQNCFILNNGTRLFSVQDLLNYLPQMPDAVFFHHVSASRNDFSAWIKHIFGSNRLSEYVLGTNSREDLINRFKSFL